MAELYGKVRFDAVNFFFFFFFFFFYVGCRNKVTGLFIVYICCCFQIACNLTIDLEKKSH